MRANKINTMYRRRSVRPDSNVYRQTRKIAGGSGQRMRTGRRGALLTAGIAVPLVTFIVVVAWLIFR